ncbi:hypothetical protein AB0B04_19500 [Streptomyces xinghaiensis]|uniref:Uncharacterized protein n=2 Tax=Streptomyces TaxID=1883 RepID=A0A420UXN3_9ACTN|nr:MULTISPECIES: hypothetical protein [Streptomyces]KNE83366.1 hypothetical protein ADZ36_05980 [Streptomyces fradiae]OFA34140.1 hypothetical protein BEN35_30840 [Streptomyces fradiae]PQM20545.1 hypothetical protein Sfr7A_25430 [Streptomyces xinghaiensis]RKM92487.1 hypothetical protein SFRA_024085 [Streptomyces xinghaiensis]RNC70454.1 hypothetical protein DC095_025075 [Streptomyces xinghaiensis]
MTEPSVNSRSEQPRRIGKWLASFCMTPRKGGFGEYRIFHHFVHGVAFKLGSGAVTLVVLWWETRH